MYPTKSIQFLTMCRWKYADVRREADVEGPDEVEEESNKRELSNKTISHWNEVFRLDHCQSLIDHLVPLHNSLGFPASVDSTVSTMLICKHFIYCG